MVETVQEQEAIGQEISTAVRHTAVFGFGNVLAKALGFLMLPLYTHYLRPVDYGILELLELSMSLLGMFLNMGMTAAVLRSYAAAKSADERRQTVSTAFIFAVVTGSLSFVLALTLIRPLSALILGPDIPPMYLMMSVTSFVLGYIANLPRTYLRALEASGAFVAVDTAALFVMLSLNIIFIAVLKIGLVAILLSSLIVVSLQVILLSAWTIRKVGLGFSHPLLREMLAFGAPLMSANVSLFTLQFADRFFLQHLRSIEVVGVYAVGHKLGYMLNFLVVQPFFIMWQSRMFVIYEQPNHEAVYRRLFVLYSLLLTYVGLALSVTSPEIVRLMVDSKFAGAQDVIPLIALSYIFYGLGFYAQLGLFLSKKTGVIGAIGAAAAILNLGLNYFLISKLGMIGAALATLLSFMVIAVSSYVLSQRELRLPLPVGQAAVVLLLAGGIYLAGRVWTPESLVAALLTKTLWLAAFPVVLWRLRLLSPSDVFSLFPASRQNGGGA
jgi:O-antigen/teichoic acid export membrane protein